MRNFIFFLFWLTSVLLQAAEYGSVVFSELMADPEPAVGLPAVEYVELCNRSSQAVSLKGWSFWYGDKTYPLPAFTLNAGAYLLLGSKAAVSAFPDSLPTLPLSSFPTLLNSGKTMALVSSTNEVVCCLDYSDRWYGDGFKANGGWSLECKDLSNLSGASDNWTASKHPTGGTPGRVNSVAERNPAWTYPHCTRVYIPGNQSVELHFSDFMPSNVLANPLNYRISPENTLVLKAIPGFPDTRSVVLQLSDTLLSGMVYDLTLTGLSDVSGFDLPDTVLQIGLPEPPVPGSLQCNEILFNPLPGGSDYLEFVQTADRCIDLSQVWLTRRDAAGRLEVGRRLSEKPLPCLPGSYWLLSEHPDSVCMVGHFPNPPNVLCIGNFPSLPDDEGNVVLVSSSAEVIDEMAYSEQMHFSLMVHREGVSLEKRRPDLPSGLSSNWVSASSGSRYGTPGFKNSQFVEPTFEGVRGFYTRQAWLTPNNDGRDDRVEIMYELPEACVGSLDLYDLQGRLIRRLVNQDLFATQGSCCWDGMREDGSPVPFGRYILVGEVFTPAGQVIRNKLVLTVLF